ncbi:MULTISPECIES: XRE family transcriptional regulator [Pantoea]|uniref:XRE family transcriptional regulator n=1 Tax=Pantoea TaxID=53335 RepID=UPI0004968B75|nr:MULTISPECIES: S24 family peptidase [Pantoea]MDI3365189.1 S24 family peptidase [Pantoea sp. V108_6]
MKTLAERLKAAREKAGISQADLAEKIGLSQQSVAKIENGETQQPRKIKEIASALNVTQRWLQLGLEDTERGDSIKSSTVRSIAEHDTANKYRIEVLDLTLSAGPGAYMLSEFVEVLAAIEFTNEHARALFGGRQSNDVKVMTIDGDSMYPTIKSGDRLFFDVSVREFKTDGVYAFVYGKTFHVKRLQMQGVKLAVLSDNPNLEKWFIEEGNEDQFYVMGKALLHESVMYSKI